MKAKNVKIKTNLKYKQIIVYKNITDTGYQVIQSYSVHSDKSHAHCIVLSSAVCLPNN